MGFIHCRFCHGRGCLACDGQRKKYEAERTEALKNWKPPSDEEVILAKALLSQLQIPSSLSGGITMSEEELDTRMRMPQPIATIKTNNGDDMELAKQFLGAEALQKIAEETDGDPQKFHEQFLKKAEEFRIEQGRLHENHGV